MREREEGGGGEGGEEEERGEEKEEEEEDGEIGVSHIGIVKLCSNFLPLFYSLIPAFGLIIPKIFTYYSHIIL